MTLDLGQNILPFLSLKDLKKFGCVYKTLQEFVKKFLNTRGKCMLCEDRMLGQDGNVTGKLIRVYHEDPFKKVWASTMVSYSVLLTKHNKNMGKEEGITAVGDFQDEEGRVVELNLMPQLPHTLALLPSVKREVFCVGDRLKMLKHKAWATTIIAPKLVGSMTTKGQMKPTCRVSLLASQAGENSQSNVPEHTIVSSILTDLIFRRNLRRRTALSGPTIESAKQPNSSNAFPNSKSTQYHH